MAGFNSFGFNSLPLFFGFMLAVQKRQVWHSQKFYGLIGVEATQFGERKIF